MFAVISERRHERLNEDRVDSWGRRHCGATWNPVTGCTKVSEGCDNCYAETFAERWRGVPGHPFEQGFDVRLWPERLTLPLRWRKPRRVFLNSMSDLWHEAIGADLIARVFAVMAAAEQHVPGSDEASGPNAFAAG